MALVDPGDLAPPEFVVCIFQSYNTVAVLTHFLPIKPKKGKTNVIMMVGLQGAGKTTTCTKVSFAQRGRTSKMLTWYL